MRPDRAVVLCHEMPLDPGAAEAVGRTYPSLADRLCRESAWRVVAPMLRGAGGSDGDFSASGWLEDLRFVVDREAEQAAQVCAVGFGLGGALALRLAVDEPRVIGVGALGAPSDLLAWARDPASFLEVCRSSGVVSSTDYPIDLEAWVADLAEVGPVEAASALGDRPLLVVQGTEDTEVPVTAARALAHAAGDGEGGRVELRLVPGAGHRLLADPRALATLIGWLERQR